MQKLAYAALAVLVVAGCSKPADVTMPLAEESSRIVPGIPPLEQSNMPRITIWTDDGFREAAKVGTYALEPIYDLAIPEGQTVTFHWSAHPTGQLIGTRWKLDPEDLFDEGPRNGDDDLSHWGSWSTSELSATIGPFESGAQHLFYLEAQNKNGLRSLVTVRLNVTDLAAKPAG